MRKLFFLLTVILVVLSSAVYAQNLNELKQYLNQAIKNPIDSIRFDENLNMYEVITKTQIFYLSKDFRYLIIGPIIDISDAKNPKNITFERQKEYIKRVYRSIDKSVAIKVGTGPIEILEFTSPKCPHCKEVDKYLTNRKEDVTRYIYIEDFGDDTAVNYVLCTDEQQRYKSLKELYSGNYPKHNVQACELAKRHKKEVEALNLDAVPVILINSEIIISGANIKLLDGIIQSLLGDRNDRKK